MMSEIQKESEASIPEISDIDIYEAMKEIEGYLDITPGDFKLLYNMAYRHAVSRLAESVKVKDVMTRNVVFISKDTPLIEVAEIMATKNISGVPVVDFEKKPMGVISEKDFAFQMGGNEFRSFMSVVAQCLQRNGCVAVTMRNQKAEDIMTHPAISVTETTSVSEVANILAKHKINRLPVVDKDGKIAGIIARADIISTSCTLIIPQDRSVAGAG